MINGELVADNFAGGGASTGIEMAMRCVRLFRRHW